VVLLVHVLVDYNLIYLMKELIIIVNMVNIATFLFRYGYMYSHRINIVKQKIIFLNDKLTTLKNYSNFSTNFYDFKPTSKPTFEFEIREEFMVNKIYSELISKYLSIKNYQKKLFKAEIWVYLFILLISVIIFNFIK
jgi:hypothetical protein